MSWNKIDCITGKTSFELKEYRNHFILILFYRLKWIGSCHLFWIKKIGLVVSIPFYILQWIQEILKF